MGGGGADSICHGAAKKEKKKKKDETLDFNEICGFFPLEAAPSYASGPLEEYTFSLSSSLLLYYYYYYYIFFVFLGPHLRHMEVPRLGVQSEL